MKFDNIIPENDIFPPLYSLSDYNKRKSSLPGGVLPNFGDEKNEKFLKSKAIQNEYEKGNLLKKEEIFVYAQTYFNELIYDTYENYILQKILEIGIK